MNRVFFATLATATTGAHVLVGDAVQQDTDGHLHLLQVSARRSNEKMELEKSGDLEFDVDLDELERLTADSESVAHPVENTWPIQDKPSFGPDGTWATPYCKSLLGCDRYCPDGCNGGAMWFPNPYENTRVGQTIGYSAPNGWKILEKEKKEHFIGCWQGKNIGGPVGYRKGPWLNCFNSENSTKPSFWGSRGSDQAQQEQMYAKFRGGKQQATGGSITMTAYGREFCPAQCVNDCVTFKYGNFNGCGASGSGRYDFYNMLTGDAGQAAGPNPKCNTDHVTQQGIMTYLWCGEPTTTTTTTEAPTTTEALDDDDFDEGDVASAVDDPHVHTVQGQKLELS